MAKLEGMNAPTFSSIEAAIEFLESPTFRHVEVAGAYGGKRCLFLLALDEAESLRFRRIKSKAHGAIGKEVVISGLKRWGVDAAKTIVKSYKGDVPGTLRGMFSTVRKILSSDPELNERISASSAETALYMRLEELHRRRAIDPNIYMYAKHDLGITDASMAIQRVGELDGCCVFFYRF